MVTAGGEGQRGRAGNGNVMNSEVRIQELEQKVVELTALVERMAATHAPQAVVAPVAMDTHAATDSRLLEARPSPVADSNRTASRRGMLKLAGAAAAGTVVAAATNVLPAAALDGDALKAGQQVDTSAAARNTTELVYTNTATPQVPGIFLGSTANANIFITRDTQSGFFLGDESVSSYPAAVAGYSYRTVANGVYGYTGLAGAGVVGYGGGSGSVGVLALGAGANLELIPEGVAPTARPDAHRLGQVICDATGNVWSCVVAGTPGTFRKITGATVAGAFHALAPGRVYDSRKPLPLQGTLGDTQNRTISVSDKRDANTGAVTLANFVPAGATAVTANITVVTVSPGGFLTVNPGGSTAQDSSTINWFGSGQILANGVTLTLNATRQLTIVCAGATDFIVDISGYFL